MVDGQWRIQATFSIKMSNSKYVRVLVHVYKQGTQNLQKAPFSECILSSLGIGDDGLVECNLEDNKLILQTPENKKNNEDSVAYKLKHPPFCPLVAMDQQDIINLPPDIYDRGVDVGVVVILETSDNKVLLTKRAMHMRTFPGVWVPPGGHIEVDESLETAVLRELEEETGIDAGLDASQILSSNILGLWESVFPPMLGMGPPARHHIVVYKHIALNQSSQQLTKKLKLSPEEVAAAVWLNRSLVERIVYGTDVGTPMGESETCFTAVNQQGEHSHGSLDSETIRELMPQPGVPNVGRLSTGSRYALSLWLDCTSDASAAPPQDRSTKLKLKQIVSNDTLTNTGKLKNKM